MSSKRRKQLVALYRERVDSHVQHGEEETVAKEVAAVLDASSLQAAASYLSRRGWDSANRVCPATPKWSPAHRP